HRGLGLRPDDAEPELVQREAPDVAEVEVPLPVHLPGQRQQAGPRKEGLVEIEERRFGHARAGVRSWSHPPDAPRLAATTPARIESAISSAVRAPMSSPSGVWIRARSSSPNPIRRSSSTYGPTWRRLPITPTKATRERSSVASDRATPGASWSVWTAYVWPSSSTSSIEW